jgi:alpha-tubulin suppressor-like RCC1 family protein
MSLSSLRFCILLPTTLLISSCVQDTSLLGPALKSKQHFLESRPSSDLIGDGTWVGISAGHLHTCALKSDGVSFCWGNNDVGQLGNGGTSLERRPSVVAGALRFSSISVGSDRSCGLTGEGDSYCWGYNGGGQLGDGRRTFAQREPTLTLGGLTFASISPRGSHTCGLTRTGDGYCWGYLGSWLGFPSDTDPLVPTPISEALKFVDLAAGGAHTCGIAVNGTTLCWGDNLGGMLGIGSFSGPETCLEHSQFTWPCSRTPIPVLGQFSFVSVTAGGADFGGNSCGLTSNGQAYCWGLRRGNGQLGANIYSDSTASPTLVSGGYDFALLSSGYHHTCGITTSGVALCWGNNRFGQLGDGSTTDRDTPVVVSGNHTFATVSAGFFHSCGTTVTGEAWCWGNGESGQLGNGAQNSALPVQIVPAFAFNGFFRPIENRDPSGNFVLNVVKAGSAIPVKFSLGGNQGLEILSAGSPSSDPIVCAGSAITAGFDPTLATGGAELSYDPSSDTYTYVWKTDRSWRGCRQLVLRLTDGTEHRASFQFDK